MHTIAPILAHFVHRLNPMFVDFGVVQLWYYGLAYCLGFIGIHLWLRRPGSPIQLGVEDVYDLTLLFALGVLVMGRAFEIVVYERDYYAQHPGQLFSYWRGGMASHGVLLGGTIGIWLFCRLHRRRFLQIADEIMIPAALFLALGRIGNFINGEIYGSVTEAWWGVRFPNSEEIRHPVTLYESVKNLAIIPILLIVRHRWPCGRGLMLAHFVFWYGFLRIFTDCFREYGAEVLGIGTGQYFNAGMAVAGLALIGWCRRRGVATAGRNRLQAMKNGSATEPKHWLSKRPLRLAIKRVLLLTILILALTIPSSWTRGVLKERRDGTTGHAVLSKNPIAPEGVAAEPVRQRAGQGGPKCAPITKHTDCAAL